MTENHIRENIKFLRAKLSLTQGGFGSLFGVTRDNIASYERGTKPKIDFITRLVNYFQISYDDFIGTLLEFSPECSDIVYDHPDKAAEVNEPSRHYQTEDSEPVKNSGWQNIPIYDLDATSSLASLFLEPHSFQPIDYLASSSLPPCDGGIRVNGDGMAPVINPGDIVLYKQVYDISNAIIWGGMYLLSFELGGDEYIMVRYIHQSNRSGHLQLLSHNPHYPPKEVSLSQIKALGLIKMSIRINSLG